MNAKRLYWGVCGGFFAAAALAWASTPYLDFTINMTSSLPGTLYVVHKGGAFKKGDLIAYRWHGGATYPAGTTFIKRVEGIPGDTVKREGAVFWVNEHYIGWAKPKSRAGVPLTPAAGGAIAPGEYFVATPSVDSLDSRYALSGNIKAAAVIGRAYAIF